MKNGHYRAMPLIVSIVIVVAAVAFLSLQRTSFSDALAAITALVGILAIWFQMKRAKDMEEGSFIVGINDSFLSSDGIRAVYRKLVSHESITEEDRVNVVEYLTFFETVYILYKRNLIDIAVLDDLFSYRFFIAVNNPDIQRLELICDACYYKNIYTLDYVWSSYRRKQGKPVEFEGSLAQRNPDYRSFVEV